MPRRKDLNNDLTGAERTTLVNLMLPYLTDEVVKIRVFGGRFLSDSRGHIAGMEQFLLSQGGAQFVPLPKWNPANEVPVEFRIMKPTRQDGSPWFPPDPHLPPVQNPGANPHRAMPDQFAFPSVCGLTYTQLEGGLFNSWYSTVENGIGGIFAQIEVSKAVPLYWCWRAFADEIYYDWEACPNVHPSLIYWMISLRSGQAADIKGGSLSKGAPLIQWDWHSGANQQWTFIPLTGADDGYYLIRSVNSGLVLDVSGASTQNGAQIHQWIQHEGDHQKWKLIPVSWALNDRQFYIQNKNSEMFMDVKGGSEVAGTKVIQWPLNGNDNQVWRILALGSL